MPNSATQHQKYAQVVRLVELARADVPLGRRLTYDDRIMVRWTIDNGDEDTLKLQSDGEQELRRHRILRLIAEASSQGAAPTDHDLAEALGVSRRTIESDMAALQAAGMQLPTRRRSRSR
jgi:DNA-binding transcriptional ArsR family regulator